MHFPLIVTLSLIICVCQVFSQASTDEYSEQNPWSFVYTLYPFYNSETVFEVWKTDKVADTSTSVVTPAPNDQDENLLHSDNIQHNETNLKTENNASYLVNEVKSSIGEQLSRNRQRLASYRNRHKDANSQNE